MNLLEGSKMTASLAKPLYTTVLLAPWGQLQMFEHLITRQMKSPDDDYDDIHIQKYDLDLSPPTGPMKE